MAAKKGLGKGLDSLITDKVSKPVKPKSNHAADAVMIDINKVEPNREQPRKKFDEDALIELSESIKQFGILQPLLCQERDDYYEIVAGERRWRAAKLAGLKEVPVIIKKLTNQQIMEISLIENIQREDLNPIEEALAYKRLLKLNEKVQQMVIDEMLTTGHARALLGIEDQNQQYVVAQQIFDQKLSVRDTEKLVKSLQKNKKKTKSEKPVNPQMEAIYKDLEEKLKKNMGTKVLINRKNENSGKIEIEYYSHDELDRIVNMLNSVQNQ